MNFTLQNKAKVGAKPFYILNRSFILIDEKEYRMPVVWRGNIEYSVKPGTAFEYSVNLKAPWPIKEQINKVGKYSISWKYGILTSNTITIEVSEPEKTRK